MNSFKSVCSFAKTTPVPLYELQQDVEPFVGCQTGVEIVVGFVGIFETAERLNDSVHIEDFTTTVSVSLAVLFLCRTGGPPGNRHRADRSRTCRVGGSQLRSSWWRVSERSSKV